MADWKERLYILACTCFYLFYLWVNLFWYGPTLHPDRPMSYEQDRKSRPYMRLTSIWANVELS